MHSIQLETAEQPFSPPHHPPECAEKRLMIFNISHYLRTFATTFHLLALFFKFHITLSLALKNFSSLFTEKKSSRKDKNGGEKFFCSRGKLIFANKKALPTHGPPEKLLSSPFGCRFLQTMKNVLHATRIYFAISVLCQIYE